MENSPVGGKDPLQSIILLIDKDVGRRVVVSRNARSVLVEGL